MISGGEMVRYYENIGMTGSELGGHRRRSQAAGMAISGIAKGVQMHYQFQMARDMLKHKAWLADKEMTSQTVLLNKQQETMGKVETITTVRNKQFLELAETQKETAVFKAHKAELEKTRKVKALNTRKLLAQRRQYFSGSVART